MRSTWIAVIASVLLTGVVARCNEPPSVLVEERTLPAGHSITDGIDHTNCAVSRSCDCGPGGRWLSENPLKDIAFGASDWLDVGGSYRARHHRETNMRPGATGGLSGVDDSFWLHQTRLWFDGRLNSRLRFRVGLIDAASSGERFSSRAGEVNRHDLYQAHVNAIVYEGEGTLTARVGRQEIRYGSARLMMAPGWANRRRTHDGVRLIWESDDWEINPFWIQPVFRDRAHFRTFDNPNPNQQIYGVFSTYKRFENDKLDLYWLAYDLLTPDGDARYDTLGGRYYGGVDSWVYEFEGGVQLGENPDDTTHDAGFFTGGGGRKFASVMWQPELWVFFDWASGDNTVGNGFHSYVQRAHYYLGFMDLFGRRNLEDLNIRLTARPTQQLTLVAWCHFFSLANGNDVPYNTNMRPFAGLTAGSAGSQTLGSELDLLATYDVNEQTQLRMGYCHFWSGTFYETTPGVPTNLDGNFLFGHFLYRF